MRRDEASINKRDEISATRVSPWVEASTSEARSPFACLA
jgi:hypothetical protein